MAWAEGILSKMKRFTRKQIDLKSVFFRVFRG